MIAHIEAFLRFKREETGINRRDTRTVGRFTSPVAFVAKRICCIISTTINHPVVGGIADYDIRQRITETVKHGNVTGKCSAGLASCSTGAGGVSCPTKFA